MRIVNWFFLQLVIFFDWINPNKTHQIYGIKIGPNKYLIRLYNKCVRVFKYTYRWKQKKQWEQAARELMEKIK